MSPWVSALRPKTLPASISPILLASALAYNHDSFDFLLFIVALSCAIFLQIAVNLANDYFDAKSGVDSHERLGPIRVTQSQLIAAQSVFYGTLLFSLLAMVSGLYLAWQTSWALLSVGGLSLLAVFAYSGGPWPLASHGLGELTVFLFFGWLAVAGTYFIFTEEVSLVALAYGSISGLFSAAIMLVNNIRDRKTDAKAGKFTLAVKLGDFKARCLYLALLFSALLLHFFTTLSENSLLLTYLPLSVCLLPCVILSHRIFRLGLKQLNALLAQTALLLLLYCLSVSIALMLC